MKSYLAVTIREIVPRQTRLSGERATIERLLAIIDPAQVHQRAKRRKVKKRTA